MFARFKQWTTTHDFPEFLPMIMMIGFSAFTNLYPAQPLFLELSHYFHVSVSSIALVQSLILLALALSAPFVSACNDLYGKKRMVCFSFTGLVVCQILSALSFHFFMFFLVQAVLGFFIPALIAAAVTTAHHQRTHDASLRASRFYSVSIACGGMCSRLLSGFLTEYTNWRIAYFFIGFLTAVFAVFIIKNKTHPDFSQEMPALKGRSLKEDFSRIAHELCDHFQNKDLLSVCFNLFLIMFSITSIYTTNILRLSHPPFLASSSERSVIFSSNILGCLFSARLMPYFSKSAFSFWHLGSAFLFIGLFLCLIPQWVPIFLGTFFFIAGCFALQIISLVNVSLYAIKAHSSAIGLSTSAYYLGGVLSSYLIAYLYQNYGPSWDYCALFVAILLMFFNPLSTHPQSGSSHSRT